MYPYFTAGSLCIPSPKRLPAEVSFIFGTLRPRGGQRPRQYPIDLLKPVFSAFKMEAAKY